LDTPYAQGALEALAESIDCFTEEQIQLLFDVKPGTTESWAKRGLGPPYCMVGNRRLYPRTRTAEYARSRLKERKPLPVKDLL
jgi:hypothetical protein